MWLTFRFNTIVAIIVSLGMFFEGSFSGLFAQTAKALGYAGELSALSGLSVSSMALRSDGRILYALSGNNVYVVDLQEMGRKELLTTLTGTGVGVALLDDSRLAAVSTTKISYFDVSTPFLKSESGTVYEFAQNSGLPSDACKFGDSKIAVLHITSSNSKVSIKVISAESVLNDIEWFGIFPSSWNTTTRFALRCTNETAIVIGSHLDSNGNETLWYSNLDKQEGSLADTDYSLIDFTLTDSHLLFLRNRKSAQNNKDDSRVFVVPLSSFSTAASSYPVGQGARAIARLIEPENAFGFFIATDRMWSETEPLTEVFARSTLSLINEANPFGIDTDRGAGLALAGANRSLVVASKSDHYSYMRTASTGVQLLSRAPTISVSQPTAAPLVTKSDPLSLSFSVDRASTYEIRFEESPDEDAALGALSTSFGNLLESGSIAANTAASFTFTHDDLGVKSNASHRLMIYAREEGSELVARYGVSFQYDPPPDPVSDFSLGFGDQTIQVAFNLPTGGDISTILLYFTDDASQASSVISEGLGVTLLTGERLASPLSISAASWDGSYLLKNIPNGTTLYMTVQVVDGSGQISDAVETKSVTVYRTRSLAEAFGSTSSCVISSTSDGLVGFLLWALLVVLGVGGLRGESRELRSS